MATPTLLSVSNVALPNLADSGNVAVTIPTGANACVIGGTYYVGDSSVITSITGSVFSSTANGGLRVNNPSGGLYMGNYAQAFKVTATGSQTVRVQKTGTYSEGPTCQIGWFTVDNPDNFVPSGGFSVVQQTGSPQALAATVNSNTTDYVLGMFGTDGSSADPSAPTGTTLRGTMQTTQFDKSIAFSVNSPGASTTTVTAGSRDFPSLFLISLRGIGGGGGASQSVAFTLADISAAFAQVLQHSQSLATSLDGVSVAVAQKLQHSQALTASLESVVFGAAQVSSHPQALAITLDGAVVAINQTIGAGNSQAISFTLDGVAAVAAQTVSHPQSLMATLDGVVFAAAQAARHPQSLSVTLDDVSASVIQGLRHGQALAATLDGISVQIEQSFSSPNKDQALAITLDDVSVSIGQQAPESPEVIPTYVVGKKTRPKERKLMGGPRWQRHELGELSNLITGRPYEEAAREAEKQAQDAISKASKQEEIASLATVADAMELLAKNEANEAQALEAAILAEQQALEDAQIMAVIAELL